MKVGFNARLLAASDLRGWNRYTVNLLAELEKLGVEPILYTDKPIDPAHLSRMNIGQESVRLGAIRPYVRWEQAWLPRQFRRDGIALFHAPANFGLPWISSVPRVLTLHDAIEAAYYAPRKTLKERWKPIAIRSDFAHATARRAADRVITVSPHARDDLIRLLGIPSSKIRVTPEAADPIFHEPILAESRSRVRALHGLERPYFFYVGGWEGRKNIGFLVKAFAASGLAEQGIDLVLAGGKDAEIGSLRTLSNSLKISDHVRPLNWVEDADLPALYAESLAMVYPSEYEGFGLQICEAMATGCPVLAARATCLPWVLGDGGKTFSLESIEELSELLKVVALDPRFRDDLVERARRRSSEFRWRKTAETTLEVYRELLQP